MSRSRETGRVSQVVALLEEVSTAYEPAAFATSFGVEDMVLLDLIARHARRIEVFTLDTGRLPDETYDLMSVVRDRYPVPVRVYCPPTEELETYVRLNGPNGFYQSVAQRQECCHVRKVLGLERALRDRKAWITGLRRAQSSSREDLEIKSWDQAHGLYKFNPLLEWSLDEVWDYVREHEVPYNALHDRGFPSIGCAPCTRAVAPGEDLRSGRWWWEDGAGKKECGLHVEGKS